MDQGFTSYPGTSQVARLGLNSVQLWEYCEPAEWSLKIYQDKFFWILKKNACMYYVCEWAMACLCRSESSLWESILISYHGVSGFALGLSGLAASAFLSLWPLSLSYILMWEPGSLVHACHLSTVEAEVRALEFKTLFSHSKFEARESAWDPVSKIQNNKAKSFSCFNNYMKYLNCWYFKVMINVGFSFLVLDSTPILFGNNIDKASSSCLPYPHSPLP